LCILLISLCQPKLRNDRWPSDGTHPKGQGPCMAAHPFNTSRPDRWNRTPVRSGRHPLSRFNLNAFLPCVTAPMITRLPSVPEYSIRKSEPEQSCFPPHRRGPKQAQDWPQYRKRNVPFEANLYPKGFAFGDVANLTRLVAEEFGLMAFEIWFCRRFGCQRSCICRSQRRRLWVGRYFSN